MTTTLQIKEAALAVLSTRFFAGLVQAIVDSGAAENQSQCVEDICIGVRNDFPSYTTVAQLRQETEQRIREALSMPRE